METCLVSYPVLLASSLLVMVLVLLLVREVRLRCALQRLLTKLLNFWRRADVEEDASHETDGDDAGGGPVTNDRMR
jgi:hypothetical protein